MGYLSGLDGTVPEEDVLAESAFVQVPLHVHKTPVETAGSHVC